MLRNEVLKFFKFNFQPFKAFELAMHKTLGFHYFSQVTSKISYVHDINFSFWSIYNTPAI